MQTVSIRQDRRILAVLVAFTVFAAWTFATWLFEGRIETLLRPEAAIDRAAYAVVVNLLIGIAVTTAVLRFIIRRGIVVAGDAGFGGTTPSLVRLIIALALGFAFNLLQGSPSLDPAVLANAFAQVLVVSAAEVVVCWALVGATVEALLRPRGRVVSIIGATLIASIAFGAYHFAHSAPFNTLGMVMLLTAVGLVTSAFFFLARDVYATIVFHNFLGMFGVVQALGASDQLNVFETLQPPLLIMAVATIGVLAIADWTILRLSAATVRGDS